MKSTNLQTYSSMANSSISLKLLIDTQAKRVLFAEAGKEFVDFLFHILSLPVAKIITLLGKQEMVGSLGNLYQSIGKLNESYIQPNQTKKTLLKPDSGYSIPLLAIKNARTANKFYTCRGCINVSNYVSDDSRAACPDCGLFMNEKLQYVDPPQVQVCSTSEGGFMKGVVTYMVMDDLAVMPLSTISSITLLNKFNVKDLDALEEKVVTFGKDEAVKLLKASLETKNVLTHVFLNEESMKWTKVSTSRSHDKTEEMETNSFDLENASWIFEV